MMLEELQRRNYAATTVYYYLKAVEQFAKFFHTSPDQPNRTHLRTYQAYLLRERKLGPRTVKLHVSALRFFFVKNRIDRFSAEDAIRLPAHCSSVSLAPPSPIPVIPTLVSTVTTMFVWLKSGLSSGGR
jgi:integrase/recombinase XerD